MAQQYRFTSSVSEVFEVLTCSNFLVARSEALAEKVLDCTVQKLETRRIVTMRRVVERELPAAFSKIAAARQTVSMHEEWQSVGDSHSGTTTLSVEGFPVVVIADFHLAADGAGAVFSVEHSAKVKIPLLGKAMTKFVLSQTQSSFSEEMAFLNRRLEG